MHLIHSTLTHKVVEPQVKTTAKYPALVLLHGRGADENDLLNLADYLDERLFLISVRAPFVYQHGGGYTWYDIEDIGKPEPKMFAESYNKLMKFLGDIRTGYPVDSARIYLCGFSMGATIAFAAALTDPGSFAGVIANSGYIPEDSELKLDWQSLKGKPFFISHGIYDPVIPVTFGRRASELLHKVEADVHYREYDMGHQIGEESLNDIMQWLTKSLDRL